MIDDSKISRLYDSKEFFDAEISHHQERLSFINEFMSSDDFSSLILIKRQLLKEEKSCILDYIQILKRMRDFS